MYDIAQTGSLEELIKIINERMHDNWMPIGGLIVVLYYGTYIFAQALIKIEHDWYGKESEK